jgi:hypothetical protein
MSTSQERKITALLPEELLRRAMRASGEGITSTLRLGLELVAAKEIHQKLLKLKGKVDIGIDLEGLRESRKDKVR